MGRTVTEQDGGPNIGPPQSKTAYVVARLRREIAEGLIVPGEALRQTDIADRYGVSPTPVREALRTLEAAGAISYAPNRGATVREMSARRTDDLYLLRAELESFATGLGVERMTGTRLLDTVTDIQQRIRAMEPSRHGRELALLNRELHFAIYQVGSELVANHVASLWEAVPPTVTIWRFPDAAEQLNRGHDLLIEAIAAGDAELARRHAREHIELAARLRKAQPG